MYHIKPDQVDIIAVIHGSQQTPWTYFAISDPVSLIPFSASDHSPDNPLAMDFDRVVHGIGSEVGAIGPLHSAHDHPHLSEDVRVA